MGMTCHRFIGYHFYTFLIQIQPLFLSVQDMHEIGFQCISLILHATMNSLSRKYISCIYTTTSIKIYFVYALQLYLHCLVFSP